MLFAAGGGLGAESRGDRARYYEYWVPELKSLYGMKLLAER